MVDVMGIPFGKGEAQAMFKNEIIKRWQDRWDRDVSG